MSRIPYASTVGSIMYAMICIKPNMAYSLGAVSRYQSDPDEKHWKIVKVILKYLRNTKDPWLIYGDSDVKLVGYTDFSFQSNCDDSRSVSELCIYLEWRSCLLKKFQATYCGRFCMRSGIHCCIGCCKGGDVVAKVYYRAENCTFH